MECPKCNGPMRLKQVNGAQFYGCERFPSCRGSLDLTTAATIKRLKSEKLALRDRLMVEQGAARELRKQLEAERLKKSEPQEDIGFEWCKPMKVVMGEWLAHKAGVPLRELGKKK